MKPSHKLYILALMSLVCALPMSAQQKRSTPKTKAQTTQRKGGKESFHQRLRQEKRQFIITELNLSDKEINNIMPILDELDSKLFQVWSKGAVLGKRIRKGDKSLTEAELNSFLDHTLDARIQEAELEKNYYNKCRGLLPTEKLVRLPFVCKDFARRFFERHKK